MRIAIIGELPAEIFFSKEWSGKEVVLCSVGNKHFIMSPDELANLTLSEYPYSEKQRRVNRIVFPFSSNLTIDSKGKITVPEVLRKRQLRK
jgi:hypothetical protein